MEYSYSSRSARRLLGPRAGPKSPSTPPSRKRDHLVAAAQEYLQSHQADDAEWRIDLAAIEFGPNGTVTRFDVLQNAIEL